MGTISSNQNQNQNFNSFSNNYIQNNEKKNSNWRLLNKKQYRQILQSKRAGLLVQRYIAKKNQETQIFLHQNTNDEENIFQWRNKPPHNEVVVSILSKEITKVDNNQNSRDRDSSCSYNICPSQDNSRWLHVVTERILRLNEIQQMIEIIRKVNSINQKQLSQTQCQEQHKINKEKVIYQPFFYMKINREEALSILVDWLRGIQQLCYKFGYFRVNYQNLGITMHKRGNVWINENFAINFIQHKNKINVSTAEEKFKFQKDTINKIFTYVEGINWFKRTTTDIGRFNLEKFNDLYAYYGMNHQNRSSWKTNKINEINTKDKHKCFVDNKIQNLNCAGQQDLSNKRRRTLSSDQYIFQSCERLNLIQSDYNKEYRFKSPEERSSFSRSNTQKNLIINSNIYLSPFPICEKKIVYYKQTAPSNEHIQQSFNSQKHSHILSPNKFQPPRSNNNNQSFFKSEIYHNNISPENHKQIIQKKQTNRPVQHFNYKNSHRNHSFDEGLFRSYEFEKNNKKRQNISMDMGYLMGPQKHQRIYKALKQQKIALIDSMVMVQQHSSEVQEQTNQMKEKIKVNFVLEESIILKGLDEDKLNQYQKNQIKIRKAKK